MSAALIAFLGPLLIGMGLGLYLGERFTRRPAPEPVLHTHVNLDWDSIRQGLPADHVIQTRIIVDWSVIHTALDGAGYVAVPKDQLGTRH